MTVQSEIHAAFQWVCRVYDEARALMADVDQAFDERGFARLGTSTLTAYGSTLRATDPRQDDYPVVYIAAQFFYLPEDDAANEGTAAFVAISFHDRRRTGPTLLAGTTRWTDANARLDHWFINATARAPGWGRSGIRAKSYSKGLWLERPAEAWSKSAQRRRQTSREVVSCGTLQSIDAELRAQIGAARMRNFHDALVAILRVLGEEHPRR